jgi:hypothetical protein
MALTLGRGRVFIALGVVIPASYGIGYVVLTVRGVRPERSVSLNRQE